MLHGMSPNGIGLANTNSCHSYRKRKARLAGRRAGLKYALRCRRSGVQPTRFKRSGNSVVPHQTKVRWRRVHQRQAASGDVRPPKPTPKQTAAPGRCAWEPPSCSWSAQSERRHAKGISPIIAERLSPNRMPSPRRRCCGPQYHPNYRAVRCSRSRGLSQ